MEITKEAIDYLNKNGADYVVINSNISSNRVTSCCAAVNPKFEIVVSFGTGSLEEERYNLKQYEDKKIYVGKKAEKVIGENFKIGLKKSLFSKKLVLENFEEIDLNCLEDMNERG